MRATSIDGRRGIDRTPTAAPAHWVAVWAIRTRERVILDRMSNRDPWPVKFGVSRDPDDIVRKGREWCPQGAELIAALWVHGPTLAAAQERAKAVRGAIDVLVTGADLVGRWLDIDPAEASAILRQAAALAGVTVDEAVQRRADLANQITSVLERGPFKK